MTKHEERHDATENGCHQDCHLRVGDLLLVVERQLGDEQGHGEPDAGGVASGTPIGLPAIKPANMPEVVGDRGAFSRLERSCTIWEC